MHTSSVSAVICGAVIAVAAGSAVPASAKDDGRVDGSKFVAAGQCRVSDEGRTQSLFGRNRFRGSLPGSSYGGVFFAGGAGNRVNSSSGERSDEGRGTGSSGTAGGSGSAGGSDRTTGAAPGGAGAPGGGAGAPGGGAGAPGGGAGAPGGDGSAPGDRSGVPGGPGGGDGAPGGPVPSPNPEPASLLLIATGLGGLIALRRSRRQPTR